MLKLRDLFTVSPAFHTFTISCARSVRGLDLCDLKDESEDVDDGSVGDVGSDEHLFTTVIV